MDSPPPVIFSKVEEGKRAFIAGKKNSANPYEKGSPEFLSWNLGYNKAMFDSY